MSLQTETRFFLRKFLKNPLLVAALTYLVTKMIRKYLNREALSETQSLIKSKGDKDIIFDTQTKMYILTDQTGDEIYAAKDLKDVEAKL